MLDANLKTQLQGYLQNVSKPVELIASLRSPQRAIVVVEHDMEFVEHVADLVSVLHEGRLLGEGSMQAVRANPKVIQVYLGR